MIIFFGWFIGNVKFNTYSAAMHLTVCPSIVPVTLRKRFEWIFDTEHIATFVIKLISVHVDLMSFIIGQDKHTFTAIISWYFLVASCSQAITNFVKSSYCTAISNSSCFLVSHLAAHQVIKYSPSSINHAIDILGFYIVLHNS